MVFNVDETFDSGTGMSTGGRSDFGAVNVLDFSFVVIVLAVFFWAFDLLPKHEQSASVDDFFLTSVFGSISSFSVVLTGAVTMSLDETIFDVTVGTSSSNDGGDVGTSFDKTETGSAEGNSKSNSGTFIEVSRVSVVCFSTTTDNSGGSTKCVSVIVYFCSVDNNSSLVGTSVSSDSNTGKAGIVASVLTSDSTLTSVVNTGSAGIFSSTVVVTSFSDLKCISGNLVVSISSDAY